MRQCLLLLVFVGIAFAGNAGEAGQATSQTTGVDAALQKAAETRTTARDTADADGYARYTLDDAWLVSPSGGFRTKQQNVEDLRRLDGRGIASFSVSEDQYRMFGDTAIRTYRRVATGPEGQKSTKRFVETWVRQRGEWKLAAESYRDMPDQ